MIYLCANLPAYRQLKKLGKEILQNAEEAIRDFQESSGCDLVFKEDGNWVFETSMTGSKGEVRRQKRKIAVAVMALKQRIQGYERRLQGFGFLIDSGEGGISRAKLEAFRKQLLAGTSGGEQLITKQALRLFEGIFVTTPAAGNVFAISDVAEQDDPAEQPVADFLVREELLSSFSAAFESIYLDETDSRIIVVPAKPGDGGLETIQYALDLSYSSIDAAWITIRGGYSRFGEAAPVTRSISQTADFCSVCDHLNVYEQGVWERQLKILVNAAGGGGSRIVSDCAEIDFFQIIDLQLTAYERCMEGQLLPPAWLCENYELFSDALKRACFRVVDTRSQGNLVPVLISSSVPEEIRSIPHILIPVPDIQKLEIVSKASIAGFSQEKYEISDETAELLLKRSNGSMKTLYRLLSLATARKLTDRDIGDPLCGLLSELPPATQKALLFLIEGDLVMQGEQLDGFLRKSGLPDSAIQSARSAYREMKLDSDRDPEEASFAATYLEKLPGISRKKSLQAVCDFLAVDLGGTPPTAAAVELHNKAEASETGIALLRRYVDSLLESNDIHAALAVVENAANMEKKTETAAGLSALKLRANISSKDAKRAVAALSELRAFGELNNGDLEGQRHLEYARYYYATGALQEGLQESKNALINFQQRGVPQENEAYLYIGLNMLAQSRVDEAEAYLRIARESTPRDNAMLFILNGIYAAITQFMIGNLTKALAALTETESMAKECALHRFQVYLVFLKVRIQFELGRYDRCIELCSHGLTLCALYGRGLQPVFARWLKRAEAFSGSVAKAAIALEKWLENAEARLFFAEALFLSDQQERALKALQQELVDFRSEPQRFEPAEQMKWSTGFAQMEDRGMSGELLGLRIRAFRAYLQSMAEETDSGINELARITREEKLSNIDPYNGLYFYFYACAIGKASGANNLDRLTALSKALKYIQERAATMDNSDDKLSYLRNNYFNGKILEQAKESNLM